MDHDRITDLSHELRYVLARESETVDLYEGLVKAQRREIKLLRRYRDGFAWLCLAAAILGYVAAIAAHGLGRLW